MSWQQSTSDNNMSDNAAALFLVSLFSAPALRSRNDPADSSLLCSESAERNGEVMEKRGGAGGVEKGSRGQGQPGTTRRDRHHVAPLLSTYVVCICHKPPKLSLLYCKGMRGKERSRRSHVAEVDETRRVTCGQSVQ